MFDLDLIRSSECVVCGHGDLIDFGSCFSEFLFGSEILSYNGGPPRLFGCRRCGIIFKDRFLTEEAEQLLYQRWLDSHGGRWAAVSAVDVGRAFCGEVSALVERFGSTCNGRVLDIGAGEGGYLDYLEGWDRFSLDVSESSVTRNLARGINSFKFDICSSMDLPSEGFDVVTCFDVMEHLRDPSVGISNMCKLLGKGGVFIGETGDVESLIPRIFGPAKWWYALIPEHKVIWSERAIRECFKKEGVDIVYISRRFHKGRRRFGLRNIFNFLKLPFVAVRPSLLGCFRKVFLSDHLFFVGVKKP